jgi:hypothetical protein
MNSAFKEWAVICRALAVGDQSIILRKGGIDETDGSFQVEYTRFWLYPTYTHQQRTGVKEHVLPLLEQAEAERPPARIVRLTHFAEVHGVYRLHNLAAALAISSLHSWSLETVQSRFLYHHPGLHLLLVRVYGVPQKSDLPETPHYAGCRSWVELEQDLPTEGATPVLDDRAFSEIRRILDERLKPTGLA